MLVLSRKVGEKLLIGDRITIVVNRVAGNRVTLGIEAPLEVPVLRGEIVATPQPFKEQASTGLDLLDDVEPPVPSLAK